MIIPKGAWSGGGTVVLPPCDGTECNARSTYGAPTGEDNFYNDPPTALPDIQEAWGNGVHVYTEAQIDLTASPYNTMHTASWFSDSSELGTNILRKYLWRDTGGYMPGIDVVGYGNSVDAPTSNCWLELERLEIHPNVLGVGPPHGFPGSTR